MVSPAFGVRLRLLTVVVTVALGAEDTYCDLVGLSALLVAFVLMFAAVASSLCGSRNWWQFAFQKQ